MHLWWEYSACTRAVVRRGDELGLPPSVCTLSLPLPLTLPQQVVEYAALSLDIENRRKEESCCLLIAFAKCLAAR